ncbi:hypothetical protein Rin_00019420, partial [Candidatus Regiella insecticola 5.15]
MRTQQALYPSPLKPPLAARATDRCAWIYHEANHPQPTTRRLTKAKG